MIVNVGFAGIDKQEFQKLLHTEMTCLKAITHAGSRHGYNSGWG